MGRRLIRLEFFQSFHLVYDGCSVPAHERRTTSEEQHRDVHNIPAPRSRLGARASGPPVQQAVGTYQLA